MVLSLGSIDADFSAQLRDDVGLRSNEREKHKYR
ncbi:uncharacterized protein METZ01_LOCUS181427 [marine metagenome]|uniref:Uncharacterized protein n=1 Tax=marine metagenome TaxID=408172 RepID=A0A382CTC6_9ZZZZ